MKGYPSAIYVILPPLQGGCNSVAIPSGVSLRSTPGYLLARHSGCSNIEYKSLYSTGNSEEPAAPPFRGMALTFMVSFVAQTFLSAVPPTFLSAERGNGISLQSGSGFICRTTFGVLNLLFLMPAGGAENSPRDPDRKPLEIRSSGKRMALFSARRGDGLYSTDEGTRPSPLRSVIGVIQFPRHQES